MKITNPAIIKVRLLNEKMIKEKLMKKAYSCMVWSRAAGNFWIKLVTLKNFKMWEIFKHK